MFQVAVIADDFTSVTDCTISFAAHGLTTAALISVPEGEYPPSQVIGLNTDSRVIAPQIAYERNKAAAEQLRRQGCRHLYKSVDSTLRGNLGAEIDGVMDGCGASLALVAPAFPHYGRTTVNGFHYLNGNLLENSPIARDPSCPAKESEIAKILRTQSGRKSALLPLDIVRGDDQSFLEAVRSMQSDGYELLIADAETEDDLGRVAKLAAVLENALVVGSTGLVRHMAACWSSGNDAEGIPFQKTDKNIIVAAASVSPVTAGQVEQLLLTNQAARCLVPPDVIAFGDVGEYEELAAAILESGQDLVLQVDSSPKARKRSSQAGKLAGVTDTEVGARIVKALARITAGLLSNGLSEAVVMTGGDMAQAVLQEFGSGGMELYGEVEPGIPIGRLMGDNQYLAVTKAGAFGTPQALLTACAMLRQRSESTLLKNHAGEEKY